MIHVQQTKLYDPGPPVYRGNCFNACIASLFEIEIDSLPDMYGKQDQALNRWLAIHYPGVSVRSKLMEPTEVPVEDSASWYRQGFWLATVESPRFSEECGLHAFGDAESHPPMWYKADECPHCGGSGTRPGYHLVLCNGREVVHDPHPDVSGYGWEYNGRLCGQTWFEVHDPARLIPRSLPLML